MRKTLAWCPGNLSKAVLALLVFELGATALLGQFAQTNTFTGVNLSIPDGDRSGVQDIHNIVSDIAHITSVRVRLNVAGNFNGDLYGYVRHRSGGSTHISVLLNRPGRATANGYGYFDSGFDVTFADSAAHDIHTYQSVTIPPFGTPLFGTWQPDARFVDPAIATTTSPRTVFLSEFEGLSAQGEWILFLADMEAGGTNSLNHWGLEITGKAMPSITWTNPAPITYGTALGSGQLNATANVPGTFAYNPPAGTYLPADANQTLAVTFVPDDTNSYVVATASVTLNVLPRILSLTASSTNKTYGSTLTFVGTEFTSVGLVNGDQVTNVTLTSAGAAAAAAVGSHAVAPSAATGTGLGNYSIGYVNGTLIVEPAVLVGKANDASRAYGQTNPVFNVTYRGLVNGEGAGVVTGPLLFNTGADTNSPVGVYPIQVSGQSATNYTIQYVAGTLTVAPAALLVRAADGSRPYGQTNPVFTATISGLVNGEGPNALGGTLGFNTVAATNSPVGAYAIKPGGLTATNYALTFSNGTLTVTTVALTVSADDQSRTYGATNPPLTGTLVGLQNGDNITATFQTAAATNSPLGAYPIRPVFGDPDGKLGNYRVLAHTGTLIVEPAALVVTATSQRRLYGQTNPVLTVTYTGLVNGESPNALGGTLLLNTTVDTNSPVGVYPIHVSGQSSPNYTIQYVDGTLTVEPAALLVRAADARRAVGQTNPVFTVTYTGLVNGEGPNALGGTLVLNTAAATDSPVGTYAIEPGGLTATNYALTFSNGTLTVTAFALTVRADDHSRTYGANNPPLTGTLVGLQNGDNITATFHTAAATNSPVGAYPITPIFDDPDGRLGSYSVLINTGTLTVEPAALVVTAASQRRLYGQTNPVLTVTYTGLVNGEHPNALGGTLLLNTAADTNSPVGVYPIHVSGQSATNYTIQYVDGTLTVEPAALLVRAADGSRPYGQTNPLFTATISGLVNGEDSNALGGTLGFNTAAVPNSPVGAYAIEPGGLTATNYALTFSNGTLTVTAIALTVSADDQSRTYGATNPPLTGTLVGVQNGDDITATFHTAAAANSPVGPYPISPIFDDPDGRLGNYSLLNNTGTLTVEPAALVVRANAASRAYGRTNPVLTVTYTGLVNGESPNTLGGTLLLNTTADTNSPVGVYPIHVSGQSSPNYTIQYVDGTLAVEPAALMVRAADARRAVGQTNPVFTATISGLVNGEGTNALGGTLVFNTAADTNSPAGAYAIEPGGLTATNYALTFSNGTLTVTAFALTVRADDHSRAYGANNPPLTGTLVGVQNGDNITATFHTAAATNSPVGAYPITPIFDDPDGRLGNYSVLINTGTLTVEPAVLVVSAASQSRLYGQTNPVFTVTYTGLVNGEGASVVTGPLLFNTAANTNSPVGPYPIHVSGQSAPNYTIQYVDGTLTVEPAALMVRAADARRAVGQTNPVFTVTYTGLVNGESPNVLGGTLGFNTAADTNSPVGAYAIEPGGLTATNYALTFSNGTLTVTAFALTVRADDQSRTYGAANPPLTGTLTGLQNGDNITATFHTAAATNSPVGTYPIRPIFDDPDGRLGNYSVLTNTGTLTVKPAALVVRAADASRAYGQPNPVFTVTYTGLVNGEGANALGGTLGFNAAADMNSPVGAYAIKPGGLTATNYALTFSNGTLTVTVAGLTVRADDQSRTYGAPNPPLTGTLLGVRNGDNITAKFHTAAVANSPVGTYPITPALEDPDGRLGNYSVLTNTGTFRITKATSVLAVRSSANPALLGSSVNFTVTLTALAPSTGIPSGTVQFKVDGAEYGAPVPLVGGNASLSTAPLPVGEHSINVQYAGDGQFLGATAVLDPPQVINTPPVAAADVIARIPNRGTRVPVSVLLANDSDADGDAVVFDAVSATSTAGGTLRLADGWVHYTPPAGFNNEDSFSYTVRDGRGGYATGTVAVAILADRGLPAGLTLRNLGDGTFRIAAAGLPWGSYTIEFTESLRNQDWGIVAVGTADGLGNFVVDDAAPMGTQARFYRAIYEGDGAMSLPFRLALTSSANPALPGASVTFAINLTALPPGSGTPSGTVQFRVDGADYGAPVTLVGGNASLSTASLPLGEHSVSVKYAGDGDFRSVTGFLGLPQVINTLNTPPLAAGDVIHRDPIQGTKHLASDLLANDSDPDGDPLVFDGITGIGVKSDEGGSLSLAEGWIFYTPPAGFVHADSFTYRVRDSRGETATATVEIVPRVGNEPSANLALVDLGSGTYRIVFSGIPWRIYTIQYTESLAQPNWQSSATKTADSQGRFEYDETLPQGTPSRFYRSVSQFAGPTASPFRLAVWTNFIGQTNGRTMEMWTERTHPAGWPNAAPVLAWNTNCLLYGFEGFTGVSQCNEFEGSPGQVPVTLLTRRHGYTRGHQLGENGLRTSLAGKRVWFCTASNTVVQMTVAAELIRTDQTAGNSYDYGLVVFAADVPESISPVFVMSPADMEIYYWNTPELPYLFLAPEQAGHCAAGVPPFVFPIFKGGDSGSPNLIPSPDNKLIMFSGRSTSGFSAQMQADIDALSVHEGLPTNNYQLRWHDLSPWAP